MPDAQPAASQHLNAKVARVFGFIGLSGAGWLFDTLLFVVMTSALHVAPGIANAISGVIAASAVFAVSNRSIFGAENVALGRKTAIFAAYQLVLIALASMGVAGIDVALKAHAPPLLPWLSPALYPLTAKCLVTPFTLAANYFVGRAIAHAVR